MPEIKKPKERPVVCFLPGVIIFGQGKLDKKFYLNRLNFVRLAEKAVEDYEEARNLILKQTKTINFLDIWRITNKLEDCILTVRRVFRVFERIKNNKNGFFVERIEKKLLKNYEKTVTDVRDLIEHIEKEIDRDSIPQDRTIALTPNKDASIIFIGRKEIRVEDLANIIERFYKLSLELAVVDETKNPISLGELS